MEWTPEEVIIATSKAIAVSDKKGQRLNISADAARTIMDAGAELSRLRIKALEILVSRLLKARESGMSMSDMQAMAREAGGEP